MLISNRICQVRLVRMHDTTKMPCAKLLSTDGCPGKIYFEGFLPHEFVKLTNFVMSHGGVVVPPDEETIILSETKNSLNSKYYPRFDVQWLQDSIKENKLQDIGKYLIPFHSPSPSKNSDQILTLATPRPSDLSLTSSKVSNGQMSSGSFQVQLSSSTELCALTCNPGLQSERDDENECEIIRYNIHNLSPKAFKQNSVACYLQETKSIQSREEKKKRSHSKSKDAMSKAKKMKESQLHFGAKCPKKRPLQKNGVTLNHSGSGNNDESVVESSNTWKNCEPLQQEINENNKQNETPQNKENDSNGGRETKDDSPLNKSRNSSNKIAERPSRKRYSTEENNKIIQYLSDRNLLHKPIPRGSWKIISRDLKDLARSRMSIQRHFTRFLVPILKASKKNLVQDEQEKQERKKLK